jgi:hypothetical protein
MDHAQVLLVIVVQEYQAESKKKKTNFQHTNGNLIKTLIYYFLV